MSCTVTAFFDSRSDAEAAKSRLQSSNIDADRIRIVDQESGSASGSGTAGGGSQGGGQSRGFFGSMSDFFMSNEDRHAYQEGINRGGYLLCATVDEGQADEAMRVLEETNCVDFDSREEQWRGDGWAGWTGGTMNNQTVASSGTPLTAGQQQAGQPQAGQQQGAMGMGGQMGGMETGRSQEEHIPVVEEELRVGKRQVNRGSARVRSYVREVPVHEEVALREEHVSVERRPVGETLERGALDRDPDLLRDRTVEMTETAEEAVVGKEARVVEEVVVSKTAEEHVEQIDDTVRRTEVDVDRDGSDRSAFGFDGDRNSETGRADFERSNDPTRRP